MSVVVVGQNSFLARHVKEHPGAKNWTFISHAAARDPASFESATCVINFALHDDVRRGIVTPESDLDSAIAQLLANANTRYILISTRAVYGISQHADGRLSEDDAPAPASPYGQGKFKIEKNVSAILPPEKLAVLRLGNIFGFEATPGRSTFFAMALNKLRDQGVIEYDIDPSVKRDFLPASLFADLLIRICTRFKGGTYNLGSGFGTETGKIAEWVMEGYGGGRLVAKPDEIKDAFWLDMQKTNEAFNLPVVTEEDIAAACRSIGRALLAGQNGKPSKAAQGA